MSGIDLSSVTGLATSLTSALPAPAAIAESLMVGAASNVVLSGIKAQLAPGGSLAPFGSITQVASGSVATPQTNNPNTVVGPTITASAFASLPSPSQANLIAAGVHIVSG